MGVAAGRHFANSWYWRIACNYCYFLLSYLPSDLYIEHQHFAHTFSKTLRPTKLQHLSLNSLYQMNKLTNKTFLKPIWNNAFIKSFYAHPQNFRFRNNALLWHDVWPLSKSKFLKKSVYICVKNAHQCVTSWSIWKILIRKAKF